MYVHSQPCLFPFFCGTKSIEKAKLCVCAGYVHTDLRKQFLEIARKHSPEPRSVYSFMTTAVVRSPSFIPLFRIYFLCPFAHRHSGHASHDRNS